MSQLRESKRENLPQFNQSRDGDAGKREKLAFGLAGVTLIGTGIARRSVLGLGLIAAGGGLAYRALTGAWPGRKSKALDADYSARAERAITIQRPVEDVYRFFRDFENLPRVMDDLESVTIVDSLRSHWVARLPGGRSVEWDAEIINETPNELIAWRTFGDADVESAGSVRFSTAPGNRGTEIHVKLEYMPPLGPVGARVAEVLCTDPDSLVRESLRSMKAILEAGTVATTVGQPRGTTPKWIERIAP